MEIDEGPPPFPGVPHTDTEPVQFEESEEVHNAPQTALPLPLPNEDFRSRSPMIQKAEDSGKGSGKDSGNPEDVNDKGDTAEVVTAISAVSALDLEDLDDSEDDEWGDFGAAAPAPIQVPVPATNTAIDDDDDEWGAFDQARPESGPDSARSEAARQLAHQQSIEEWGSFENSGPPGAFQAASPTSLDEEDEWQAEFTAAPVAPTASAIPEEHLETLEKILEDEEFWDDGFEDEQQEENGDFVEDLEISDIPAEFDLETLKEDPYSRLWLSLRVVEEAISLKFDWKESRIRGNHFKAIKINPKTIKKEPRTAAAAFDTANLLLPSTPLQPTSPSSSSATTMATEDTQKASTPPTESPSIPAADFDWDTSGLTNPMNRAHQNSAIIDVDFLSTNGVATSYTSPLQKELEEFGLTLANGAGSGTSTVASANILDTIMSQTNGRRSPAYRNPEVLSLDAQKLLEKLPDLQYLQSEVLMFPVGTNLPH